MKIVVLGTRGFPDVQGGVEKHCENLYPRLVEKGCEVTVFTRAPYCGESVREYKGVKLVPLSCPRSKFLEAFVHTLCGIFAAKKLNPDILHIHAIGPSLFVPLARLLGLKVVMTHHGPDYMRKKWNIIAKVILRLGECFGVWWANEVICVSEWAAHNIKVKYRRDAAAIPNGVVIVEHQETEEALKKFGLEKGKYILAVGRFVPEKGLGDLIEAFGIASSRRIDGTRNDTEKIAIRNDGTEWKLVIVGDADHEDKYSRELKIKAKENANIVLTGFLTGQPLVELYSHAGLFVLSSYYEGLPIALLEAMSYGLSCIASDISANREVGLTVDRFFKAGDIEALGAKIKDFMEIGPMSEKERDAQMRLIREKYDWDKIAEATLGVYKSLCIC